MPAMNRIERAAIQTEPLHGVYPIGVEEGVTVGSKKARIRPSLKGVLSVIRSGTLAPRSSLHTPSLCSVTLAPAVATPHAYAGPSERASTAEMVFDANSHPLALAPVAGGAGRLVPAQFICYDSGGCSRHPHAIWEVQRHLATGIALSVAVRDGSSG